MRQVTFSLLLVCTMWMNIAFTQEDTASKTADIPKPIQFVTQHKARFNGVDIKYTATAGETYLTDIKGQAKASIFTFSYVKSDTKRPEDRPLIFIWNGGPGSASTWLHMGGFGPKRIVVPSDAGHAGLPPYNIGDAPETLLDVADLVFIDPVGTGFSRALGDFQGKDFWGLYEDANAMAEFIRTWTTANNRWQSPRFIMGESYGTTRAAAVANILENDFSMSINGLIFISQALDYQGSSPYIRDNIISHITYLPTMAATALYHNKLSSSPESQAIFLQQARDFAHKELLPALFEGSTITPQHRNYIIDKLHHFTGISKAYIDQVNLRIEGFRFAKELLRDERVSVGLLDSRYTQQQIDDVATSPSGDAGANAISSAYLSALMSHMRNSLNVTWDRQYLAPADPELSANWRYRAEPDGVNWEPSYVNTAHDLSQAMHTNPYMKVFIASGYFDLVTPFYDAEFTLNRHDIPADRLQFEYYQGGHMMYVHEPSRLKLLSDTRAFIVQQTTRKQ